MFHFTGIFQVRDKQKRIAIIEKYTTNPKGYVFLSIHITHVLLTSLEERHNKKIDLAESPSSSLAILDQIWISNPYEILYKNKYLDLV